MSWGWVEGQQQQDTIKARDSEGQQVPREGSFKKH